MMKPGKNFHRGFHSWEWIRGQEADPFIPTSKPNQNVSKYIGSKVDINPGKHRLMSQYLNNRSWWKDESDHFAGQVMQSAASWITRYGSKKPWMLWVESFDPHEPWDAPKEFLELYSSTDYQGTEPIWPSGLVDNYTKDEFNRIKAHYAGECSHVDRWVGHIVETLQSQHLLNDTIVVFMSDHGCIMGEQGQIHKGQDRLRIQATRCPLIIRMPEAQYAGTVVDGFVQHQDIMPTLLGLIEQHVVTAKISGHWSPKKNRSIYMISLFLGLAGMPVSERQVGTIKLLGQKLITNVLQSSTIARKIQMN